MRRVGGTADGRPLSMTRWVLLGGLALGALGLAGCGQSHPREALEGVVPATEPAWPEDDKAAFPVPPPPFTTPEIFPCSGCHDKTLPPDPKRRVLTMAHDDIVLKHDERHRWCLDCHDTQNRDMLHLASGELVDFKESYRLCGQCHGDKYRDWRAGVHGRRTGMWNGEKQYLLCVNCHYSHDPHFKPLKPLPPPTAPRSGS